MARSNFIAFKASAKERQILETIAAQEERTVSEMLRELIREGAAKRGLFAIGNIQLMSRYEVKHEEKG